MKYLIKFFIMMAVLCAITACSQAFEDVSNNKKKQETTKGRLVMKVGSKSRTILPDISIVESDIKTARLTANGTEIKSWSGSGIIEQIENEDDILLDVGIYDFEMTFCNENGNVFLMGTIGNKEIKAGDNSLVFDMKLVQGTGNIAIGLSWEVDCKISKIKAGLYDIATGEAVAGYEAEEIAINGTVAGYIKENVPSGQYIIKFEIYDNMYNLLNTLTDVIKIANGKTSVEQKTLSNINTLYTITYNLNGGSWKSGFTPVTVRNVNTGVALPTYKNITKTGYKLSGWYTDETFSGEKIEIIPSGTTADITLYAKYEDCYVVTAEDVPQTIAGLAAGGPYNILVTGTLTSDTISSIRTALKNNSSAKVNLDLSDTTGLTSIGNYAFYGCSSLTSVVIGNSVTSIGKEAFQSCSSLTSVVIPDGVTSIGWGAFQSCSSLTNLTIPDSVTSIGEDAFSGCSSLTSVYITDLEAWCNIKFSSSLANPLDNGANLYLNGSLVKDLVIPDSVTSIGDSAFENCDSLTSVIIPDSVTSIGKYAFYDCDSLTSVTIGDSVTSIGEYAFSNCSKLTSVTIPDSVTSIGNWAFWNCSSLTSVTIPDSVTSIGGFAFSNCSKLTSVTIPDSVTSIGGFAFRNCSSLTSIVIPDSVTSIGEDAFSGCSSLTSVYITDLEAWCNIKFAYVFANPLYYADNLYLNGSLVKDLVIPDSVTSIGEDAFSGCSSLTSVTIPDSVTSIGSYAFHWCNNLTSVTIPDSVTSIGSCAFDGCRSLTSVVIGNSVTSIGSHAFNNCSSLTSVTIPDSVTSIGNRAFEGCSSLIYNEYDNGLYLGNADNPYLVFVEAKDTSITSCEINNRTKIILYNAFKGCSSLTSIVIPDSVTSIGSFAFWNCSSLTSVTIPDSVTSIGIQAFYNCTRLTSVTFKDTNNWYYTSNSNYTGGTAVNVTDKAQNATYLKSTYCYEYWYKK